MLVREVLKADPAVVDLHKMGPHYYQAGLQISTLPTDEAEEVSEILPEVCEQLFSRIFVPFKKNVINF